LLAWLEHSSIWTAPCSYDCRHLVLMTHISSPFCFWLHQKTSLMTGNEHKEHSYWYQQHQEVLDLIKVEKMCYSGHDLLVGGSVEDPRSGNPRSSLCFTNMAHIVSWYLQGQCWTIRGVFNILHLVDWSCDTAWKLSSHRFVIVIQERFCPLPSTFRVNCSFKCMQLAYGTLWGLPNNQQSFLTMW
jgi:hypothetical protein